MTSTTLSGPAETTRDTTEPDVELIARATALAPLALEQAEEGTRNGRLTATMTDALHDAGLFTLTVPRRYGGYETNSRTVTSVLTELARGDGSAAWSTMLLNTGNWFATTWPVKAQDEVWGEDPDARCCVILAPGGKATPVEGGYEISGRWPYASGSFAATHAIVGVLIPQTDGGYRHALAIVGPGDWTVERSWFPIGMRGTGSDTVVTDRVFVPAHRVQWFDDLVEGRYATELKDTEARARAAFLPTGTIIFGAVLVGLGRATLDQALERMEGKGVAGTAYTRTSMSPTHQVAVATATGLVDAAELLVHRASRDIDASALSGSYMDELTRARVRNDTGMIVTLITDAVDRLMKAAGSSAFLETNNLSRVFQDVSMAGSHVHATPGIATDNYGKLLLHSDQPLAAHV